MIGLDILTEPCVTVFNIGCIIPTISLENTNTHLPTKYKADMFALPELECGWKFSLVWHRKYIIWILTQKSQSVG